MAPRKTRRHGAGHDRIVRQFGSCPKPDGDTKTRKGLTKAARDLKRSQYRLKLFIAGATPRSAAAIRNVTEVCDKHLPGRYELEVVDIYQQPLLAVGDGIIAVPTLVKMLPEPLHRLIGDMSSTERVLVGLDLATKRKATAKGGKNTPK